MKVTAFVSHHDCPRHDPGWDARDHQGRLPAIARAVYRDMLMLYEPLLEVEAVPATEAELRRVHTASYLARLRETSALAASTGTILGVDGVPVSGATWDAVRAAAGAVLTGCRTVRERRVRNAFCLTRPPGRDAFADRPSGESLVNHVAVAAQLLREDAPACRVALLDLGLGAPPAAATLLADDAGITVAGLHGRVAPGADAPAVLRALDEALDDLARSGPVDFLLVGLALDLLVGDPNGHGAVQPDALYAITVALRGWAEAHCGGRLVSAMEGGYAPTGVPRAVVQHLRALAALPPA